MNRTPLATCPAVLLASIALGPIAASRAASATYEVFAIPTADPDDGSRTLVVDPAADGGGASPFGWHDTDGSEGAEFTITRGNNVTAYIDAAADNSLDPGDAPDGGPSLEFLYPLDLGQPPSAYRDAAVTNAFYWGNVLHDILYQHGFDETSGNFQENNYGHGGVSNDPFVIEVQDGAFTNGITLTLGPDGTSPRAQIGIWTLTSPSRDSAVSSFVLAFAYGRAVVPRLAGGTSCLSAGEAAGLWAGWSDWIGLVTTTEETDEAATPRPVGTYIMGQPPDGSGIRVVPYSTDFAVNDLTYDSIRSLPSPFGTGTVWATVLWQVYWELVEEHGFHPDLYDDWTAGGNTLALRLVLDGMKLAPCNPGFVDGRDAILAADDVLTGGANRCAIWRAFAARGLGASASQGSSGSLSDGTEAFDLPAECDPTAVSDGDRASGQRLLVSPNPVRDAATIRFTTPSAGPVRLALFDASGALTHAWVDAVLPAGEHVVPADLSAVKSSGVYFLRLSARGASVQEKVIVRR